MTKNHLKALGLALVAVFALSAVAASAASANPALFTAEVGAGETAGIDGGQTSAFGNTFSIGGKPWSCEEAALVGEALTAGPASTEATLTPQYRNCHVIIAGLTFPITITVNGCHYKFNATKETTDTEGNPTPFSADLTIECNNAGEQIEIHVYASKAKHEADEPLCTYDIKPQGPINNHIQLTNNAGGPNDVVAHITNLPVVLHNTKPSTICSNETEPVSLYNGEDTLRATDEQGSLVNASVS